MDETQKNKIQQFINDKSMSEAVYGVLLQSFLKPISSDEISFLAASRIAIDLLKEGFGELEKFEFGGEEEKVEKRQVGL